MKQHHIHFILLIFLPALWVNPCFAKKLMRNDNQNVLRFSVCERGVEVDCTKHAEIAVDKFILGQQIIDGKSEKISTSLYIEISDSDFPRYLKLAKASYKSGNKDVALMSCDGKILIGWIITSLEGLKKEILFEDETPPSKAMAINQMFCSS